MSTINIVALAIMVDSEQYSSPVAYAIRRITI
jgi:hypothetical protein